MTLFQFIDKWKTVKFTTANYELIDEFYLQEFVDDIASTFGVEAPNVPPYQATTPYAKDYLVRFTPAGGVEAFYYSLRAGVLPPPTSLVDWKQVAAPVKPTDLSQEITLGQAQGIEGSLVVAGRTYLVDFGPEPGTGYVRTISLRGISNHSFDTEGTLEVNGLRTPVQDVDVFAGTWQVKSAGSAPGATAQLLGLDPATGELLVLLSPTAPASLASYVLAEYTAGTGGGTTPGPGSNNYVASGYVASGYVS